MSTKEPFKLSRREILGLGLAGSVALTLGTSTETQAAPRIKTRAHIVIIGAGAAGTTLANRLTQRLEGARITIIDKRVDHYYQPGLSLVAAGLKPAEYVVSKTSDWLPKDIKHIADEAAAIDPEAKTVQTAGGQTLAYDFLVVAPGLVLDEQAIEGFSLDLVGREGVGCLYAGPEYAVKTWQAAQPWINQGGIALSTRPATEMKCAGAPLKHTFLLEDRARRESGSNGFEMHYLCPQNALFSVPIVAEKVRMLFGERGISSHFDHQLVALDPGRRLAYFSRPSLAQIKEAAPVASADSAWPQQSATGTDWIELPYDYIHVIPPQRAPKVVRESGLSWPDRWVGQGWVEVDPHTLRHVRYPEVFALGDVAGVPKGKTAASVKWQAPVVEASWSQLCKGVIAMPITMDIRLVP